MTVTRSVVLGCGSYLPSHILTNTDLARKVDTSDAWIAQRIGNPRAVRAVGTALGRNPVPFIVPCHRVLQTGGGLGGYLFGTDVKSRLLSLERTTPIYEGCTSTHILCRVGCVHGQTI